jgi:hypothetical protein
MKRFTLWSLVALLALSSCKREGIRRNVYTGDISLENAVVVRKGDIVFRSGNNPGGGVAIYQLPDEKFVIGLENMNFTSNINIQVHLSNVPVKSFGSEEIFAFRSVKGSLYNRVPAHIKIANYKYVVLQNTVYDEEVASAELK